MSIEKRIERIEAILDARGLDWDHPRVEEEPAKEPSLDGLPDLRTFAQPNLRWRILEPGEVVQEGDWYADAFYPKECWPPSKGAWLEVKVDPVKVGEVATSGLVFARPVADEPAKEAEPEHPAGPKPDPGEGYRLLSKNPPEELMPGDELQYINGTWVESDNARTHRRQGLSLWYRRKIEQPKPAWEPKVGDWVLVTRPENWKEWKEPMWQEKMHHFDGKVLQVSGASETSVGHRVTLHGIDWFFHRDWLTPSIRHFAEPPKPHEPEYREPVLPADFDRPCDFSSDGIEWRNGYLRGYVHSGWRDTNGVCWPCCRIKKDA